MDSDDSNKPAYKRILLKVSGEALMGPGDFGHHAETVQFICNQIKEIKLSQYSIFKSMKSIKY